MSQYLKYNDPLKVIWRKGDSTDPFPPLSDTQKIINNTVLLKEIPDEFNRVIINGYSEITNGEPTSTQFKVDYRTGIIFFNSSEEGKTVTANYFGRGQILHPASRVYIHNDNPNVVETLQDLVDDGKRAIDALGGLANAIDTAQTLEVELNNDIATGNVLHTTLQSDISQGISLKNELETSTIPNSETAKSNLENTIINANNAKTELENTIIDADLDNYIVKTEKGVANGVATLDETGNVPASQLNNVDGMEIHGNEYHSEEFETVTGAQTKVDTAETNAKSYTDGLTGLLSSLLTTAKSNIVNAINEIVGYIGSLNNLLTTTKNNLVSAINELKGNYDDLQDEVNNYATDISNLQDEVTLHKAESAPHSGHLKKSGDEMTGRLTLNGSFPLRINGVGGTKPWFIHRTNNNSNLIFAPQNDAGTDVDWTKQIRFGDDGSIRFGGGFVLIIRGVGSPEGTIAASPGSIYLREDGGVPLYVKATGTGNTGWKAVQVE